MCLVSILNQQKFYGGNIYLSIYLFIQLEIWILQSAISVNENIYFYWNYSEYFSLPINLETKEMNACLKL